MSDVRNYDEAKAPSDCARYMPFVDDVAPDANVGGNTFAREVANTSENESVDVISDVDNTDNVGGAGRIRPYPRED